MTESAQHLFDLALARLPLSLRPVAENYWRAFREHLPRLPYERVAEWLPALARVFAASDFVARTCVRQPEVLRDLLDSGDLLRAYEAGELARRVARELAGVADEPALKARLRAIRRRELLRVALRDLAGWADLPEVLATLSEFADACLESAVARLEDWARSRHGTPTGAVSGAPVGLVVLGLGKLGGRELNFSSDVDLMFAYAEEGETGRGMSNHEFFVRLGQALINALAEPTADGFVFRVDMRLRPDGAAGPLAASFDAMELYYQTHGREWERYALIKARVVAGARTAGAELLARLRPFVFRKYLDYGAIEAIRAMKALIEREVSRKGMQANIKLGPGGIREIEFSAQALQLIRGGREPALQEPQLLAVLARLSARGYLAAEARERLAAAYVFLRRVEHRLQMLADAQTHTLPSEAPERARLAGACGYDSWELFEHELERQRGAVQAQFTRLFRSPTAAAAPEQEALGAVWQEGIEPEAAQSLLRAAGYGDAAQAWQLLTALREGALCRALSADGRARLDQLMPRLLAAAARGPAPETTLARLLGLIETIGRRTAYLALLIENPSALDQLVRLTGASPWIARWIAQHPIVLDELLDPRSLYELPTPAELAEELGSRLEHIPPPDLELQMEVLREFRHAHVLCAAAADLGTGLAATAIGRYLAEVAAVVIEAGLELAARALRERHGRPRCPDGREPGFAVIGYGKLGSHELGYASDLDMIFVYEDCDRPEPAASGDGASDGERSLPNETYFARLGQRLIHILTTRTPGGILYEVDMRLRPSGKSGPLVTGLEAFRDYQQQRAWTWEHQALVRARPVAGPGSVCQAFARIRRAILCQARDPARLRQDVLAMRARMLEAHPGAREPGQFDLKHDRGGIVDIEFMVQYGVLRWASAHSALTAHTDNTRLLQALADEGLLASDRAETLAGAYRRYLSMEHRTKLMERGSTVERAEVDDWPQRVQRVWREVFGEPAVS